MDTIGDLLRAGVETTPDPRHRLVERLLIVRPQDGADEDAAASELQDLPGVVVASLNTTTGSFDVVFNPAVVSEDELAAALHHQGYDLTSWQEVRAKHPAEQRTWLLEQIRSLVPRAEIVRAEPRTHAVGVMRGSVDAYVRTARAFGLVTDAEIVELIPARFLEGTTDSEHPWSGCLISPSHGFGQFWGR